jgi:MFS superfamily sulfate permease-like transporter
MVIVVDQIPKLLGIHLSKGGFIHHLLGTIEKLHETSAITLVVGLVMIALLVGMERFFPQLPAPLAAVVFGIAGVKRKGWSWLGTSRKVYRPFRSQIFLSPSSSCPALWVSR